jgi:branched-chain amino acid transport system ATP-binding protein
MSALLIVKNLTKKFGGIMAVRNVSFEIYNSEICGLIGPNGAGKTTVMNLITKVYQPDSGRIFFDGKELTKLKTHEIIKSGIARTFQLNKIYLQQTALQNVLVGIFFGRSDALATDSAKNEAENILESLGLYKKRNVMAKDMTFFERKLLELGRAIAAKPKLLLLDEPFSGLNAAEIMSFVDFIKKLKKEGVSILLIEHIIRPLMSVADRIIVLHNGEKIAEGHPRTIAYDEKVRNVYLGGGEVAQ